MTEDDVVFSFVVYFFMPLFIDVPVDSSFCRQVFTCPSDKCKPSFSILIKPDNSH